MTKAAREAASDTTTQFLSYSSAFHSIHAKRGVSIQLVRSLFFKQDIELLTEVVCLLLDRYESPSEPQSGLLPGDRFTDYDVIDFLGINQGCMRVSPLYHASFLALVDMSPDLIEFVRILRSRQDWDATAFRTALKESPLQAYSHSLATSMPFLSPIEFERYRISFALLQAFPINSTADQLRYWVNPRPSDFEALSTTFEMSIRDYNDRIDSIFSTMLNMAISTYNIDLCVSMLYTHCPMVDINDASREFKIYDLDIIMESSRGFAPNFQLMLQLFHSDAAFSYIEQFTLKAEERYATEALEMHPTSETPITAYSSQVPLTFATPFPLGNTTLVVAEHTAHVPPTPTERDLCQQWVVHLETLRTLQSHFFHGLLQHFSVYVWDPGLYPLLCIVASHQNDDDMLQWLKKVNLSPQTAFLFHHTRLAALSDATEVEYLGYSKYWAQLCHSVAPMVSQQSILERCVKILTKCNQLDLINNLVEMNSLYLHNVYSTSSHRRFVKGLMKEFRDYHRDHSSSTGDISPEVLSSVFTAQQLFAMLPMVSSGALFAYASGQPQVSVVTLKLLVKYKAKVRTNSKSDPTLNSIYHLCTTPLPQSQLVFRVQYLIGFVQRNKAFKPQLTTLEFLEVIAYHMNLYAQWHNLWDFPHELIKLIFQEFVSFDEWNTFLSSAPEHVLPYITRAVLPAGTLPRLYTMIYHWYRDADVFSSPAVGDSPASGRTPSQLHPWLAFQHMDADTKAESTPSDDYITRKRRYSTYRLQQLEQTFHRVTMFFFTPENVPVFSKLSSFTLIFEFAAIMRSTRLLHYLLSLGFRPSLESLHTFLATVNMVEHIHDFNFNFYQLLLTHPQFPFDSTQDQARDDHSTITSKGAPNAGPLQVPRYKANRLVPVVPTSDAILKEISPLPGETYPRLIHALQHPRRGYDKAAPVISHIFNTHHKDIEFTLDVEYCTIPIHYGTFLTPELYSKYDPELLNGVAQSCGVTTLVPCDIATPSDTAVLSETLPDDQETPRIEVLHYIYYLYMYATPPDRQSPYLVFLLELLCYIPSFPVCVPQEKASFNKVLLNRLLFDFRCLPLLFIMSYLYPQDHLDLLSISQIFVTQFKNQSLLSKYWELLLLHHSLERLNPDNVTIDEYISAVPTLLASGINTASSTALHDVFATLEFPAGNNLLLSVVDTSYYPHREQRDSSKAMVSLHPSSLPAANQASTRSTTQHLYAILAFICLLTHCEPTTNDIRTPHMHNMRFHDSFVNYDLLAMIFRYAQSLPQTLLKFFMDRVPVGTPTVYANIVDQFIELSDSNLCLYNPMHKDKMQPLYYGLRSRFVKYYTYFLQLCNWHGIDITEFEDCYRGSFLHFIMRTTQCHLLEGNKDEMRLVLQRYALAYAEKRQLVQQLATTTIVRPSLKTVTEDTQVLSHSEDDSEATTERPPPDVALKQVLSSVQARLQAMLGFQTLAEDIHDYQPDCFGQNKLMIGVGSGYSIADLVATLPSPDILFQKDKFGRTYLHHAMSLSPMNTDSVEIYRPHIDEICEVVEQIPDNRLSLLQSSFIYSLLQPSPLTEHLSHLDQEQEAEGVEERTAGPVMAGLLQLFITSQIEMDAIADDNEIILALNETHRKMQEPLLSPIDETLIRLSPMNQFHQHNDVLELLLIPYHVIYSLCRHNGSAPTTTIKDSSQSFVYDGHIMDPSSPQFNTLSPEEQSTAVSLCLLTPLSGEYLTQIAQKNPTTHQSLLHRMYEFEYLFDPKNINENDADVTQFLLRQVEIHKANDRFAEQQRRLKQRTPEELELEQMKREMLRDKPESAEDYQQFLNTFGSSLSSKLPTIDNTQPKSSKNPSNRSGGVDSPPTDEDFSDLDLKQLLSTTYDFDSVLDEAGSQPTNYAAFSSTDDIKPLTAKPDISSRASHSKQAQQRLLQKEQQRPSTQEKEVLEQQKRMREAQQRLKNDQERAEHRRKMLVLSEEKKTVSQQQHSNRKSNKKKGKK